MSAWSSHSTGASNKTTHKNAHSPSFPRGSTDVGAILFPPNTLTDTSISRLMWLQPLWWCREARANRAAWRQTAAIKRFIGRGCSVSHSPGREGGSQDLWWSVAPSVSECAWRKTFKWKQCSTIYVPTCRKKKLLICFFLLAATNWMFCLI